MRTFSGVTSTHSSSRANSSDSSSVSTRGGVIDYAPTAPGPHVTTTQEVVTWLRSPQRLAAQSGPLIDRFRADYADLDDGHASARLVDEVFVPRGDATAR